MQMEVKNKEIELVLEHTVGHYLDRHRSRISTETNELELTRHR